MREETDHLGLFKAKEVSGAMNAKVLGTIKLSIQLFSNVRGKG